MMYRLKKLSERHRDIIRRMVVGETPTEISEELGMHLQTVVNLKADPMFAAELKELQLRANDRIVDVAKRLNAREILDGAADVAAGVCAEAATGILTIGAGDEAQVVSIPPKLQLESARDILDRTGYKPISKQLVGSVDIGKLISDAYKDRDSGHNTEDLETGSTGA